jgi:L-asparagine oxygenase
MATRTASAASTASFAGLGPVTMTLTAQESASLRALASQLAADLGGAALDRPSTMRAVRAATGQLPHRIAQSLTDFRCNGNEYGSVVFKHLPLDHQLVATPEHGSLHTWQQAGVSTMVQLLMMTGLGDVIAYADEKDGALVQDVVPLPGHEQRQENSGSAFFGMHTENSFHPYKPDHLGLLCLRADHDRVAYTLTASVRRALPLLSGVCVAVLRQPLYRIRYASSFGADGPRYCPALPVLTGSVRQPNLCVDFHLMEGLSEEAAWALGQLRAAMTSVLAGTVLEAGDLVIVDNRAAVHARTRFTPRYDGSDRWLRRCFAVTDFSRSRSARVPGSHICAPLNVICPRGAKSLTAQV